MFNKPLRTVCGVGVLLMAGSMVGKGGPSSAAHADEAAPKPRFLPAAVRYQVKDVERSVAFYTQHLGFTESGPFGGAKPDLPKGTPFASVSNGPLILWLSGPASSGSRPLPDGRAQTPGGWNRIALQVDDLQRCVTELKQAGLHFRNEIVAGPGGKQIQLEDPDGNPVELFEPAR